MPRHPDASEAPPPLKFAWVFTTFPKPSEVFLQREVRAVRARPCEPVLHSLWGGRDSFEGAPVSRLGAGHWLRAGLMLPVWLVRRPAALGEVAAGLANGRCAGWVNLGETLLGLAWGLSHAGRLRREGVQLIHAAWATAPGTGAWLASRLSGIPFSLDAHAYDIYRDGGDWALAAKLGAAARIRTSTTAARSELLARGAPPARTAVIRRSLTEVPPQVPARRPAPRRPLRVVSVGRFIEKKGWAEQLEIYARARRHGLPLEARLIGWGPLLGSMRRRARDLGLAESVRLEGRQPPEAVAGALAWADVFVFTGKVARSGDRDGLPNVIAEAMAAGAVVVTSPVAGTGEAIRDGDTGLVRELQDVPGWLDALEQLARDDGLFERLQYRARNWVAREFDPARNALRLVLLLEDAAHEGARPA